MPRTKRPRKRRTRTRTKTRHNEPAAEKRRSFGAKLGSQLGGALGGWAQKGISALIGRGDYKEEHAASGLDIDSNSIVKPMTASQVPIFSTPDKLHGAVRVQHREYIRDIDTNSAFTQQLRINPNNPALFPWLSTMAINFEQWLPMGIVFEFVSTAGNAFSGGAANLGDISMATQYDLIAPPFFTKSQILNHFYATSAATSQDLMHAIECAPGDTPCLPRYIDHGSVTTFDPRLNDLGIFNWLTEGSQSTYTAGQLWVTYEIILLKPRLELAFQAPYYNAWEYNRICELADKAGKTLTKSQREALLAREGKRDDPEACVISEALSHFSISEEEKGPEGAGLPDTNTPLLTVEGPVGNGGWNKL